MQTKSSGIAGARTQECDCRNGHKDQIENYPIECNVEAIDEIVCCRVFGFPNIAKGTIGKVTSHCMDGRAYVKFPTSAHTFHFPEQHIRKI